MLCALIMAGGIGTRFWPQSTPDNPKQFLSLLNEKSMLQMTYERINKLIPSDRIFIITNYNYIDKIKKQIPDIKDLNIITEPCSKNTAPCILLSTIYIRNIYKNANVVCISSDSYIKNEEKFINDIVLANEFVNNNTNAIVTIGIEPTRAETGYGYIKFEPSSSKVLKVSKFVEKPNLELANEYYQSKKYLWNAGMFIFNVKNMLEECKVNIPNEYNLLINLPDFSNPKYYEFLNKAYNDCTKISIDYAIMEKSKNVYTIPTNIGWDDIGTWNSIERYLPKDENNNIVKGNVQIIDSNNNIVYCNNKKIVLLDVEDIFCIDSDNLIIIGKKESLNKVHTLKDQIDNL
jgi:mannose-1-phosphate guanylyltransferase